MNDATGIETFISYARKDGLEHAEYLEREFPNSWRDKRNLDPFKDFTAEIERAIAACKQVFAVITPDTMREDSFVRRELAYAAYLKKPIIIIRIQEVPPPLNVFNHTWLDQFRLGWDKTLHEIRRWVTTFVSSFTPPEPAEALKADPYRDYVGTLYDSIIDYLDHVIIKEVTLKAQHRGGAVVERRNSPLGNLYRRHSVDAPEERIETLQDGIEHFKGRVLLLGEAGAGKTVSLLAAARDAVVQRLNDPKAPLPIWLRCTEWPSDDNMPLGDWIKQQHNLSLTSFDDTFIFFDGFDELGTSRVRKIRGEDDKLREETYDPRPLFLDIIPAAGRVLLSCRIKEYEDFNTKVRLNGAVTLRPLEESQIHAYLADLPELWAAISSDAGLLDMMRTPLLLSLFAFGYRDAPEDVRALRDLQAAQLSEAIFKQYVEKRYIYEANRLADRGEHPPFSLDEIYEVLGHVAMRNASGGWKVQDNVLTAKDFAAGLGDDRRVHAFIQYATLLHLLAPIEGAVRFIHLRLRDHFVRRYCYPSVRNEHHHTYSRGYSGYGVYYSPLLALASLPNAEAFEVILTQLTHANDQMRRDAVIALGRTRDSRAVEPLLAALKDTDENVRRYAAMALGRIGESAVEPLLIALKDTNPEMRLYAAMALVHTRDVRAVKPLISALNDTNGGVKEYAVEALVNIGEFAVKPLIATLNDNDWSVSGAVADALDRLGWKPEATQEKVAHAFAKRDWSQLIAIGAEAVEPLITGLRDNDWSVRQYAAEALGKIGDARAVEPLIAALKDVYGDVRRYSAEALGKIGDAPAVEPLIAALKDSDESVRRYAAQALGKIGDARAVEPLIAALKDVYWGVRRGAAQALGKIGDARAIKSLIAVLNDDSLDVRQCATEALSNIGEPAVEPLIAALKDSDKSVRKGAAQALGTIGDARAVDSLIAALNDDYWWVRGYAAEALGKIGDARAVEPLIAALKDKDRDVSDAAQDALKKIGTPEAWQALEEWRKRNPGR